MAEGQKSDQPGAENEPTSLEARLSQLETENEDLKNDFQAFLKILETLVREMREKNTIDDALAGYVIRELKKVLQEKKKIPLDI